MPINLLSRELKEPKSATLRLLLGKTTITILSLYILAASLLFAFFLFTLFQARNVTGANEELSGQIEALAPVGGLLGFLHDRTDLAAKIFAQAPLSEKLLTDFMSLVPPEAEVMEIKAESSSLLFTANVPNSSSFAKLMSNIYASGLQKVFLRTLTNQLGGGYVFTFEVKQ